MRRKRRVLKPLRKEPSAAPEAWDMVELDEGNCPSDGCSLEAAAPASCDGDGDDADACDLDGLNARAKRGYQSAKHSSEDARERAQIDAPILETGHQPHATALVAEEEVLHVAPGELSARSLRLLSIVSGDTTGQAYRKVASELSMTEDAVKAAVRRMRRRLGRLLREEVARTVVDPGTVEAELRHLFSVIDSQAV